MTGLVYLAIIALWAMFLIPWLGRHRDEQNGRRSADRYHRAMDTLARAGNRQEQEDTEDLLGVEESELQAAPTLPSMSEAWAVVTSTLGRAGSARGGAAARRRRRVLLVLTAGLAASLMGSLAGVLPGAAPAVFVVLLVTYVTALIRQAARSGWAVSPEVHNHDAERHREAARRAQEQAAGLLRAQQSPKSQAGRGWDAVPTTLPTYVSKPRATKVPRVVDLTAPNRQSTGEAMVQRAQEQRRTSQVARAQAQFDREMSIMEPDPVAEVATLANPVEIRASQRSTYRRAANG